MLKNTISLNEPNNAFICIHNDIIQYCEKKDINAIYHYDQSLIGKITQHHIYTIECNSKNVNIEFFNTIGHIEIYNNQNLFARFEIDNDYIDRISLTARYYTTVKSDTSEKWYFVDGGTYNPAEIVRNLFDYIKDNIKNLQNKDDIKTLITESKLKLCSILRKTYK